MPFGETINSDPLINFPTFAYELKSPTICRLIQSIDVRIGRDHTLLDNRLNTEKLQPVLRMPPLGSDLGVCKLAKQNFELFFN